MFNNESNWNQSKYIRITKLEIISICSNIGRKSISTTSLARCRPLEFKQIVETLQNSQNWPKNPNNFFNCRPPLICLTAFNHYNEFSTVDSDFGENVGKVSNRKSFIKPSTSSPIDPNFCQHLILVSYLSICMQFLVGTHMTGSQNQGITKKQIKSSATDVKIVLE